MMQTINEDFLIYTRLTLILIIFTKLDCKDDQLDETLLYSQNVKFEKDNSWDKVKNLNPFSYLVHWRNKNSWIWVI